MKLEHLELNNFASYHDKHMISLEVKEGKPLIIVVGQTGYGKTSLFDAINWVLYSEDYERDLSKSRSRTILDFINETAIKELANIPQTGKMSVTLRFTHRLVTYIKSVSIVFTVKKNKDGTIQAIEKNRISSFKRRNENGDMISIQHEKLFLDEILPNNVKSYFLFDGDRIYNLANPGNSQEVKDAIYRVVDLEILKNAEDHLAELAREYARKAKKESSGELNEKQETYNQELENQQELKDSVELIKKELKSIKDKIEKIENRLADLPASEKLQAKKQRLIDHISSKEEEELRIKQSLRSKFAVASYKLILPEIKSLHKKIDDKRKKGDIPKHVSETLINDILEMGKCLCGVKFNKDSDMCKNLLKRLEEDRGKSEKEHGILRILYDLQAVQENIDETTKELSEKEDVLNHLNDEIHQLRLDKQEIENELDKLPQENITVLRKNLKDLNNERDRLNREDGESKILLKQVETNLKELDKEIKALNKQQKTSAVLQERSMVSRKASGILEELYASFAEESRKEVEALTIDEFKKFVYSSSSYSVQLSKDYELQVLDSNGNRALQRMSMGQSQCLSLAFITAISRVSQKRPPLVIDMPFSRLDHKTHAAISERLPKLSEQTILFLIPEVEWYEGTKIILTSKAAHIYELDFNEKKRQTTIEQIK